MRPLLDIKWRTDGELAKEGDIIIVVDILRASTTIVTLCSMGAKKLFFTTDIGEARLLAKSFNGILIGERNNKKINGFDLGNSPLELNPDIVKNSTIVFTSTNFPYALYAARGGSKILIGALINVSAVCMQAFNLAKDDNSNITLMLAGEPSEKHAKEDYIFAGKFISILKDKCSLTTSAQIAYSENEGKSIDYLMSQSVHANELIADGFEEDVKYASKIDQFDIVPEISNSWLSINSF